MCFTCLVSLTCVSCLVITPCRNRFWFSVQSLSESLFVLCFVLCFASVYLLSCFFLVWSIKCPFCLETICGTHCDRRLGPYYGPSGQEPILGNPPGSGRTSELYEGDQSKSPATSLPGQASARASPPDTSLLGLFPTDVQPPPAPADMQLSPVPAVLWSIPYQFKPICFLDSLFFIIYCIKKISVPSVSTEVMTPSVYYTDKKSC